MQDPDSPNRHSEVSGVAAGPNIADSSENPNPTDFIPINEPSNGLVDVLMQIGREHQRFMESLLHDALLCDYNAEALEHARELTGIPRKNTTSAPS